jgi:hypothetical protein
LYDLTAAIYRVTAGLVVDQVSPLGADAAVTMGKYQLTGQDRSGPLKMDGHWSEVEAREGGVWKIRLFDGYPKD